MPSTYSTSLRLELMADGEKSGTWGTITNTNLGTLIEQGVAGVASVAHDDSASYTLTTNNGSSDEARNAVVLMTGALTADREVIVPDVDKVYIFKNGTSGGFALTFKTSGGTGVTIPNGRAAICYVDSGTGTVNAIDDGYFTDSIYIEGSSAGDFITAESTNAGATSGPDIKLYRNSASPADSDVLSKITFTANTDDGAGGVSVEDVEYASINVSAPETNETSGEAGKMVISLKRGGTTQNYIEIQGGTSSDADDDSIVFKTGGSTALTIDNNQDMLVDTDKKLQFRDSAIYIQSGSDGNLNIEADTAIAFDTDTLVVDSANNRVGIGVAAPNTQLELSSNNGAGTALNILRFNDSDTAQSENQPLGKVEFYVNDASSGGTGVGAFIQGLAQGTSGGGQITFGGSNSTATGATEGMRIDGSNRVLIGTTSSIQVEGYYRPKFQVADALAGDSAGRGILINYGRNNTGSGPAVMYSRHSGTTVGSEGNVLNNYVLGENRYTGWFSDNYYLGARIAAEVDGTPSSADMPTRLVFATTPDGAAAATERMRISQNGDVGIGEGVSINARLHVKNTIESTGGASSATPIFIIQNERVNTGSSSAVMRFDTNEISGNNQYGRAIIAGEYDGSSNVTGRLIFSTNNSSDSLTEAMRIDSSQRVLIGDTSSQAVYEDGSAINSTLQINNSEGSAMIARTIGSGRLFLTRNQSVVLDSPLGEVSFNGGDGTNLRQAAKIIASVDGGPATADMPGRLQFYTSADGSATPTERMRITNDGKVLISSTGGGTPGAQLQVSYDDSSTTHATQGQTPNGLRMYNTNTGTGVLTSISFAAPNAGTALASINMVNQNAQAASTLALGDLTFATKANGSSTQTERMRIDSEGRVGIGVSPASWDTVNTQAIQVDNASFATINGGDPFITNNAYWNGSNWVMLNTSAPTNYYQNDSTHYFRGASSTTAGNNVSWSELARIDGDGLKFNGDSAASNALDDYEEGGFSPFTGIGSGYTGEVVENAQYTKIGRLVYINLRMKWTATDGSGNPAVFVMPFTHAAATNTGTTGAIMYSGTQLRSGAALIAHMATGQSNLYIYSGDGGTFSAITRADINGSYDFAISFSYYV